MLQLYHLNQSRSFRIVWLLEELKLAYNTQYALHTITRDTKTHLAPHTLQKIHPLGKAPILVDDELPNGEQALAESAMIIEYLLKFYDIDARFSPISSQTISKADSKAWRDYTFWLHFSEGSLMPPLVMQLILDKAILLSPWFAKPIIKQLKTQLNRAFLSKNIKSSIDLLENALKTQDWLAQKFSAADIQMYFSVYAAKMRGELTDEYQHALAWLERCQNREAFKNATAMADKPL